VGGDSALLGLAFEGPKRVAPADDPENQYFSFTIRRLFENFQPVVVGIEADEEVHEKNIHLRIFHQGVECPDIGGQRSLSGERGKQVHRVFGRHPVGKDSGQLFSG